MEKLIDASLIDTMLASAADSERRRSHHLLHEDHSDSVQRFVVTMKSDTYIRPHRHAAPKWELLVLMAGIMVVDIFDGDGGLLRQHVMSGNDGINAIEIPGNTWHSLHLLASDASFLEVKPGPFVPALPTDFASWAPEEGDPAVRNFQSWLKTAGVGDRYHTA